MSRHKHATHVSDGPKQAPYTYDIAELVAYVLLPHNDDVTKPRALKTFLDRLAELGVDKGLIPCQAI